MQGWRFDDLTRTLGAATSRRQVLKGLLGGLVAATVGRSVGASHVAAAGCSVENCKEQATVAAIRYQRATCKDVCRDPNLRLGCLGCRINADRIYRQWLKDCETGDGCLTADNSVCCGGTCADTTSDPNNCGACGHACPPGEDCVHGQCQCGRHGTICDGQCVDLQNDSQHCGSCEHACGTCESCLNGSCGQVECGNGQICCQNQCVDLCNGEPPDPNTCTCNPCQGKTNGTTCGTSQICCGEQCVSNQCEAGKQFDLNSCTCVCVPVTCPTGEVQDPNTCQCVDLCAGVACNDCEQCDPGTGMCVSTCANGQVCCGGSCKDSCTCTGLPCSNGDCCPNSTDYACCDNGCCPQVTINQQKGAYCLAPGKETGPLGNPVGNCCQPADLVKLSVIDPTTGQCACGSDVGFGVACAGNLPPQSGEVIYCSCGPWSS